MKTYHDAILELCNAAKAVVNAAASHAHYFELQRAAVVNLSDALHALKAYQVDPAGIESQIDALCARSGVVFEHEDGHGLGIVRRAEPGETPGLSITVVVRGDTQAPPLCERCQTRMDLARAEGKTGIALCCDCQVARAGVHSQDGKTCSCTQLYGASGYAPVGYARCAVCPVHGDTT